RRDADESGRCSRFLHVACLLPSDGKRPRRPSLPFRRLVVSRVSLERPGRREFAELVADHVLRHVNRHMLAAVIDGKRMSDKFGENGGTARPRLDDRLLVGLVQFLHFLHQVVVTERPFLQAASHWLSSLREWWV